MQVSEVVRESGGQAPCFLKCPLVIINGLDTKALKDSVPECRRSASRAGGTPTEVGELGKASWKRWATFSHCDMRVAYSWMPRGPLPSIFCLSFTPTSLGVCGPAVSHRKPLMALELCFIIKFDSLPDKWRGI